jgi:hypothetical protein
MYGDVGKLIDEAIKIKYDYEGNPSTQARLTPELIDVRHFRKLQHTTHFAGADTAGVSGFQAPFIVLLDYLIGIDGMVERRS